MKTVVDEILVKQVTRFGSSAHVPVPKRHIGKKAYVVIGTFNELKQQQILDSIGQMYDKVMKKIDSLEERTNEHRK